jgi:hypothetical protein
MNTNKPTAAEINEAMEICGWTMRVTYDGKQCVAKNDVIDGKIWVIPNKDGKGRGWWRPINEVTFT